MKKFVNFVKKPLLIISALIFIAMIIMVIVVSCLPHGKKYSYEMEGLATIDYIFEKDAIRLEMAALDEYVEIETSYRIKDGKLYTLDTETNEWTFDGEIDAYKITVSGETIGLPFNIELKCKTSYTLRTISIVFASGFGVVASLCVVVSILDKKGIIKYKEKLPETPEEIGQNKDTTI